MAYRKPAAPVTVRNRALHSGSLPLLVGPATSRMEETAAAAKTTANTRKPAVDRTRGFRRRVDGA
jgi:hypothetical protein